MALLSFGEGWHNNHHAHPTSSRHGLTWYEIDLNWYGIWTLKKLGLARDIRVYELAPKQQSAENVSAEVVGPEPESDLVSV